MNYFIEIKNGKPFNHPITEKNFREAFPNIDTENLPPEFAKFIRVPRPLPEKYKVYTGVTYEWDNENVVDLHHFRDMTTEEKEKYDQRESQILANKPYPSWLWDEAMSRWVPPVLPPDDGRIYEWDESSLTWVLRV